MLTSSSGHPHVWFRLGLQPGTHTCCAIYVTIQMLGGERSARKPSPGAGASSCEALLAALRSFPMRKNNRGKKEAVGGDTGVEVL